MKSAEHPLVSVIIPSYNQAAFLEQAIQSVLTQDYPNLEVMVIDGGSTDGSQAIIQHYQNRLAWWVSEPDGGQAEAINKGLARAQGEFVGWLNSDDLYLPGAISRAAAVLGAHPQAGMAFGNAITIDSAGRPLNALVFQDWNLEDLMAFRIICQPAVWMRRDTLQKAGYLDTGYHYMLDHHLWLRMAECAPLVHIENFLAASRVHPAAKNVAYAERFGQEAYRLTGWMQMRPAMQSCFERQHRRIWGGAHRLNARYLLDGGAYWPAAWAYLRAFLAAPRFAWQHKHRMIYAVLAGCGAARWLQPRLERRRPQRPPQLPQSEPVWKTWPGLKLPESKK